MTGAELKEVLEKIRSGEIEEDMERAEVAANKAEEATVNTPYIGDNNTWMVWDFEAGEYVDTDISALGQVGPPGDVGPVGPQGPPGVNVGVGNFSLAINDEGHLIATINTD